MHDKDPTARCTQYFNKEEFLYILKKTKYVNITGLVHFISGAEFKDFLQRLWSEVELSRRRKFDKTFPREKRNLFLQLDTSTCLSCCRNLL